MPAGPVVFIFHRLLCPAQLSCIPSNDHLKTKRAMLQRLCQLSIRASYIECCDRIHRGVCKSVSIAAYRTHTRIDHAKQTRRYKWSKLQWI